MHLIYTNQQLNAEKSAALSYFTRRSSQKNYPHSYVLGIYKLIHETYNICSLSPNEKVLSHPLVQKALLFAIEAHKEQSRKFIEMPYIIHPIEMASRLSQLTNIEPEQIVAALLHDVVEDCNVKIEEIKLLFGELVAYYVLYLSDPAKPEDGNRATRMTINFSHFIKSNAKTKDIKMTDLISNTRSIVICDPNFAAVYVPSLEKTTHYLNSISNELSPILLEILNQTNSISRTILNLQNDFNIVKREKK